MQDVKHSRFTTILLMKKNKKKQLFCAAYIPWKYIWYTQDAQDMHIQAEKKKKLVHAINDIFKFQITKLIDF